MLFFIKTDWFSQRLYRKLGIRFHFDVIELGVSIDRCWRIAIRANQDVSVKRLTSGQDSICEAIHTVEKSLFRTFPRTANYHFVYSPMTAMVVAE